MRGQSGRGGIFSDQTLGAARHSRAGGNPDAFSNVASD
jgi:hypothetical protein